MQRYDYQDTSVATHAAVLLGMWVGFNALTFILLKLDAAAVSAAARRGLLTMAKRALQQIDAHAIEIRRASASRDRRTKRFSTALTDDARAKHTKEAVGILFKTPEELQAATSAAEPEDAEGRAEEIERAKFRSRFASSHEGKEALHHALATTQPDEVEVWVPGAQQQLAHQSASPWGLLRTAVAFGVRAEINGIGKAELSIILASASDTRRRSSSLRPPCCEASRRDTNGDGVTDSTGFDTTGDGKVDTVYQEVATGFDTTGDGMVDTIRPGDESTV